MLSNGGANVILRGVCWGESPYPTLANSYTTDGNSSGEFISQLTNLIPGVHYYCRAYAMNSVGTAYGNDFEINKFIIGQDYQGGIIFYIDGTGQHGLISAPSDQSTGTQWGCEGISIPGTSTAIGTGQVNTTAIVNGCNQVGIAARVCDNLVLNGYSDWFLPSKDELNLMYAQKTAIGGFSSFYWSSSEYGASSAWIQNFYKGAQDHGSKSDYGYYVRAVRAF